MSVGSIRLRECVGSHDSETRSERSLGIRQVEETIHKTGLEQKVETNREGVIGTGIRSVAEHWARSRKWVRAEVSPRVRRNGEEFRDGAA